MGYSMEIQRIYPRMAIEGGEITIFADDWPVDRFLDLSIWFGEARALIRMLRRHACRVRIPANARSPIQIRLGDDVLAEYPIVLGERILSDIHAVNNPAVDRLGYVYTTVSGTRDEVPEVSVYRIAPDGTAESYITAVRNATSLALDANDTLYISSRFEGCVYRVIGPDQLEVYAEDLGTPFGLTFNPQGHLFVGNREGKVYKISPEREVSIFAELPESPIAYHLALDPDGNLFVAVPHLTWDTIYMIDTLGNVIPFYSGFGRPHGIAFDQHGNLYVSQGRYQNSGIYRFDTQGHIEHIVAGPPTVGLAFQGEEYLWINTPNALYRMPLPADFFRLNRKSDDPAD